MGNKQFARCDLENFHANGLWNSTEKHLEQLFIEGKITQFHDLWANILQMHQFNKYLAVF